MFVFSSDVHWRQVVVTAVAASIGGWAGALMLQRINERALRIAVVVDRRRA